MRRASDLRVTLALMIRNRVMFCSTDEFRVRAPLFDHTVRDVLSPPLISTRWDRLLRDMPETESHDRGLR
jgi:hypothetical protein